MAVIDHLAIFAKYITIRGSSKCLIRHRHITRSLKVPGFVFRIVGLLFNLTDSSAAVMPKSFLNLMGGGWGGGVLYHNSSHQLEDNMNRCINIL